MSSQYNADGSIPVAALPWSRRAITSSTNATPIVVQCVGHGFATGDTIGIDGHLTNTHANGMHQITVSDADHFSLNGTVGNGVGGATGYAIDYSVRPLITIPGDGDLDDAGAFNPAFEGIFNLAPYFYRRCGQFHLFNVYQGENNAADPNTNVTGFPLTIGSGTTGGVWRDVPGMTGLLSFGGVAPAIVGASFDFLAYDFTFTPHWNIAAPDIQDISFAVGFSFNGGAYAELPQTYTRYFINTGSLTALTLPMHLQGILNGVDANNFNFGLRYWLPTTLTNSGILNLYGSWNLIVRHFRTNH